MVYFGKTSSFDKIYPKPLHFTVIKKLEDTRHSITIRPSDKKAIQLSDKKLNDTKNDKTIRQKTIRLEDKILKNKRLYLKKRLKDKKNL